MIAVPTLHIRNSLRHRVSASDAFYLALAEQAGALPVTAERRLAKVATRAELVP